MSTATHAWVRREQCGCVVEAMTEDLDSRHYVGRLLGWQRGKLAIERIPIEQAREELCKYTGIHPRGPCKGTGPGAGVAA